MCGGVRPVPRSLPYGGAMSVKGELRVLVDSLSEEEAAAVLLLIESRCTNATPQALANAPAEDPAEL